jgi:hypothetical protein
LEKAAYINQDDIVEKLADAIIEREDLYQDEFEQASKLAKQIYDQDTSFFLLSLKQRDEASHPKNTHFSRLKAKITRAEKSIRKDELTFKEFAFAKAVAQKYASTFAIFDIVGGEGYINTDIDGYALGVHTEPDERPALDITMFDFERYYTIQDAEQKWPGIVDYHRDKESHVYTVQNIPHWTHHSPNSTYGDRGIQTAAMIALLEEAGLPKGEQ